MLEILYTGRFKKDFKLTKKRGKDLGKLEVVISLLVEGKGLPARYQDHALVGNYVGRRECHIESDWLLIYKLDGNCIIFERTGTHTDLFQ